MKKELLFGLTLLISILVNGQNCIDPSLINPEVACPFIYDPVCGCDGVTYSNSCLAEAQGGVTSWTPGECSAGSCMDLGELDFGMCDMFLGYAWTNTGCMGLSGCGYIIDNVDYSPYFYENEVDCQTACGNSQGCINQWQLEQGQLVFCTAEYAPVCGCDGNTYSNACMAFYFGGVTTYSPWECESENNCQMIPPMVDFGDCEMALGWYLTPDGCQFASGCGYVGNNGYNYNSYFYDSEFQCSASCIIDIPVGNCPDPSIIDLNVLCPAIYDPVCGCDLVTYSNECVAYYHNGIPTWTPGACPTSIGENEFGTVSIFPNPAVDMINLQFDQAGLVTIVVKDAIGKTIFSVRSNKSTSHSIDISDLPTGTYLLMLLNDQGNQKNLRFVKE